MILRLPLLAFTALIAGGALSSAHAASHDRDTFIREQDLDHDGKVTKDEFAKGRAEEFRRVDKDHDGKLSNAEYVGDFKTRLEARLLTLPADKRDKEREAELHQAEVRFDVLDSDGSGFITPAEFDYSGWRMFMHHDTNKDGVVSKDDAPNKDPD